MSTPDLKELLTELVKESHYEGYHDALYRHADPAAFHTVEKRRVVNNHKRLVSAITQDILDLVEPK